MTSVVALGAFAAALLMASVGDARPRCPYVPKLLLADPQARIFEAPDAECGSEPFYGRARGAKRAIRLGLPTPELGASSGTGGIQHLALGGAMAAFERLNIGGVASNVYEDWVVVRNLRTGRVVHRVPSGVPLETKAGYVGVGQLVSLLVCSDGAAAWIAEDYERSPLEQREHPFFDVEAVDASGTRLLAAGKDIDPSSLALSAGAKDVGEGERSFKGEAVYWRRGGVSSSAELR